MVPAKDFKRRMVVEIDGTPHMIEHIQVQSPSARGAATLYKIKARNLKTRNRVEKSFKGTDCLSESSFERRGVEYLYQNSDGYHFMDSTDYNQFALKAEEIEDFIPYMTENMAGLQALLVNEEVIAIEIPETVDLLIVETAPGIRGNSATGRTKPATLSTGHVIQVPEHLDSNVVVRVKTETGEYLGRSELMSSGGPILIYKAPLCLFHVERPDSLTDLTITLDDPLARCKFPKPTWTTGVKFVSADSDLGTKT